MSSIGVQTQLKLVIHLDICFRAYFSLFSAMCSDPFRSQTSRQRQCCKFSTFLFVINKLCLRTSHRKWPDKSLVTLRKVTFVESDDDSCKQMQMSKIVHETVAKIYYVFYSVSFHLLSSEKNSSRSNNIVFYLSWCVISSLLTVLEMRGSSILKRVQRKQQQKKMDLQSIPIKFTSLIPQLSVCCHRRV